MTAPEAVLKPSHDSFARSTIKSATWYRHALEQSGNLKEIESWHTQSSETKDWHAALRSESDLTTLVDIDFLTNNASN